MKHIGVVMKKDLDKVFKNPRMIFSTIILPGLIIFLIYAFMGTSFSKFLDNSQNKYETHISKVYVYQAPDSFKTFINNFQESYNLEIINNDNINDIESQKELVLNEQIDAIITFEDNFTEKMGVSEPEIKITYNPTNNFSANTYSNLITVINLYKENMLNELLEDQGLSANLFKYVDDQKYNEKKSGGMILASLLPMLIITFIFSGCLASGTDAIAGEKERGTLSTLLMAPVKRNNIITGKIISTTILAVCSATSSFIGVMGSMPFAKDLFFQGDVTISYTIIDYLGLLAIFFVVAFIASSLILIASTIGKNIKEASSYAMPFFIVAMLVTVISMFSNNIPTTIIPYLIPIYNATLGLQGILMSQLEIYQFLLIIASSLVFIAIITFGLVKMFKNENILFSK